MGLGTVTQRALSEGGNASGKFGSLGFSVLKKPVCGCFGLVHGSQACIRMEGFAGGRWWALGEPFWLRYEFDSEPRQAVETRCFEVGQRTLEC